MSIGTRIKQRREELGYTQPQLATLLGVSKGTVGNYESGISSPNENILFRLFDVLKCDANFLYQDDISIIKTSSLTGLEQEYIKKYRSLDKYGQKAITDLLNTEYERCTQESNVIDMTIELPMSELPASAGTGIWLEEGYNTPVTVRKTKEAQKANIVIRVSGDSMEPLYSDGDCVLVKIQPDIEPGEIGIFIVDNEGFIKKRGKHELISVNPEYDNIEIGEFSDCRCFGKVLGKAEVVE